MDVLWGVAAAAGHAIEQVFGYVESHHWIFGFLRWAIFSTFRTEAFMPASTRSTSGSMKSENVWPSNIERPGWIVTRPDGLLRMSVARGADPNSKLTSG